MPPRSRIPKRSAADREPQLPVPPGEIHQATVEDHDFEVEANYEELAFVDLAMPDRTAESMRFLQCRFRGVDVSGSRLDQVFLRDCLLENSNWANVRVERGNATRVQAQDCRMTGLSWTDGILRDTVFTDCRADLSNWRYSGFQAVHFIGCNLRGADFAHADLTGVRFLNCDLTGAQFHHATMKGARLRNCVLFEVAGVESWDGAIVHEGDLLPLSYALAGALGIRITAEDI